MVGEPCQLPGFGAGVADGGGQFLAVTARPGRELEFSPQDGEGSAQLVAGIGDR